MRRQGESENVEIQPADPGARARALWTVAAVVVLGGFLALAAYEREEEITLWFRAYAARLVESPEILFLTVFVLALPLVGVAAYVFNFASRVVKAERIPFPGQKVIKDTPIITGRKAVKQGRAMQVMAIIMALLGVILPFGLALLVMIMQRNI